MFTPSSRDLDLRNYVSASMTSRCIVFWSDIAIGAGTQFSSNGGRGGGLGRWLNTLARPFAKLSEFEYLTVIVVIPHL